MIAAKGNAIRQYIRGERRDALEKWGESDKGKENGARFLFCRGLLSQPKNVFWKTRTAASK